MMTRGVDKCTTLLHGKKWDLPMSSIQKMKKGDLCWPGKKLPSRNRKNITNTLKLTSGFIREGLGLNRGPYGKGKAVSLRRGRKDYTQE